MNGDARQWVVEDSENHGSTSNTKHHAQLEVDSVPIEPTPDGNHRRLHPRVDTSSIPPVPSDYRRRVPQYLYHLEKN